jgi:hypothetical protein
MRGVSLRDGLRTVPYLIFVLVAGATPRAQALAPAGAATTVKVFMLALEDNGKSGKKIGCNDSVIAVERAVPRTTAPLGAAIRELLSIRDRMYGQSGLYNALSQSSLKVDTVGLTNGVAEIRLSGPFKTGGACDNPRIEAQIKETALQFPTVKTVQVFINDAPLDIALSAK